MSEPETFVTTQVLDSSIQIPSPPTLLNELNTLLDAADVNLKKAAELLARINTKHAVVGDMVAKHWTLPGYVCEAVHLHHDTDIEEGRVASFDMNEHDFEDMGNTSDMKRPPDSPRSFPPERNISSFGTAARN